MLTFDDGPMPPYTNRVLDVLAEHCVKANYFLVGRMARGYPELAAPGPRRRPYHRHPQREPSARLRPRAARHGEERDRAGHRVGRRRARRRGARVAVLPHSGIFAPPGGRRLSAVAPPGDLERRCRRRRLEAHQRVRSGAPRDRPARRKGQGHPAAARHPAGDRAGAAGTAARAQGAGYRIVHVVPAREHGAPMPVAASRRHHSARDPLRSPATCGEAEARASGRAIAHPTGQNAARPTSVRPVTLCRPRRSAAGRRDRSRHRVRSVPPDQDGAAPPTGQCALGEAIPRRPRRAAAARTSRPEHSARPVRPMRKC